MIKNNFQDFPVIRKSFFSLLRVFIFNYFEFIFKLNSNPIKAENAFEYIVHAITWGFKHPETFISEYSFNILFHFLCRIEEAGYGSYFYSKFFKQILNDIIAVITDNLHISCFKSQVKNLSFILKNSKTYIDQNYFKKYLKKIINKAFPNTDKKLLENLIVLCFNQNNEKNIKQTFKKLIKSNKLNLEDSFSD